MAWWPLQHIAVPNNNRLQIITELSIFVGEMYYTICVEWAGDH